MSPDEKKHLTECYRDGGHIYVTNQGYIHMHVYVSDKQLADLVYRKLKGRKRPHLKIHVITVTLRKELASACKILIDLNSEGLPLKDGQKHELSQALSYAKSTSKAERYSIAQALRGKPMAAKAADRMKKYLGP